MNASEAITKIKLLLGLNEEITQTETIQFSTTKLVDGTEVSVEGDFEVGKSCFVETEEEKIPAPMGVHQSEDNMVITVGEDGVITSIEELNEEVKEEVIEAEEKEEEVKMEEETKEEETMEEEDVVEVVSVAQEVITALTPFIEGLDELKEKVSAMEEKYESFSKAPAAKPIKKRNEEFEANKLDRVNKIAKLRNK